MLHIDVFLNLAKLPKRLPVKRKKVYGSLVKRKCYNVTTWEKGRWRWRCQAGGKEESQGEGGWIC